MTRGAAGPGARARLRRGLKAVVRGAGLVRPDTHTELVVDAPFAAPVLGGWSRSRRGLVEEPHVTILDPFVPSYAIDDDVLDGIRAVLSAFEPFAYELVRVDRFPGVVYLAPEPAEPFVAMTEALWRRFPEHPPYGGAFDEIVPHVTVSLGPEPDGLADYVVRRLPVGGRVEEVGLVMEDARGRWGVAHRFPLALGCRR